MQVPSISAQVLARSLNCSTIAPETRHVYGVPQKTAPFSEGSALVEFSYPNVPVGAEYLNTCVRDV
jgi:hypothetical protein